MRNYPSDPEGCEVNARFARHRVHLGWREDGKAPIRIAKDLAKKLFTLHVRVVKVSRRQRVPWAGLHDSEEEPIAVGFIYGGAGSLEATLEQRLQLMETTMPFVTEEQVDFSLPVRQIVMWRMPMHTLRRRTGWNRSSN